VMAATVQDKGEGGLAEGGGTADKCLYANCIPVFAPEIMHTAIRRWQRNLAGGGGGRLCENWAPGDPFSQNRKKTRLVF